MENVSLRKKYLGNFLVLKVPVRVNRVVPNKFIGLESFRLRKDPPRAKVVRLLTFRGIIRFDNLVGPLLPRSKIYTPTANTVLASWLLCSLGKCIDPTIFVLLESFSASMPPRRQHPTVIRYARAGKNFR